MLKRWFEHLWILLKRILREKNRNLKEIHLSKRITLKKTKFGWILTLTSLNFFGTILHFLKFESYLILMFQMQIKRCLILSMSFSSNHKAEKLAKTEWRVIWIHQSKTKRIRILISDSKFPEIILIKSLKKYFELRIMRFVWNEINLKSSFLVILYRQHLNMWVKLKIENHLSIVINKVL